MRLGLDLTLPETYQLVHVRVDSVYVKEAVGDVKVQVAPDGREQDPREVEPQQARTRKHLLKAWEELERVAKYKGWFT